MAVCNNALFGSLFRFCLLNGYASSNLSCYYWRLGDYYEIGLKMVRLRRWSFLWAMFCGYEFIKGGKNVNCCVVNSSDCEFGVYLLNLNLSLSF